MTAPAVPVGPVQPLQPSRLPWLRNRTGDGVLRLNPTLVIGLSLLVVIVLAGVLAPVLSPWDPVAQDLTASLQPPGNGQPPVGPPFD